jgi:hypothetical protein
MTLRNSQTGRQAVALEFTISLQAICDQSVDIGREVGFRLERLCGCGRATHSR